MRLKFLFVAWLLVSAMALAQQTPAPTLFFSDLTVAPNSGGQSNSGFGGAFVTIYGNNLTGASITWNGVSCLKIASSPATWRWYQAMVVQLGSSCAAGTGNFVVTTNSGTSNGLSFTVVAGGGSCPGTATNCIYFVSSSGSDSNTGAVGSPWATLPHAVQTAGAGTGNVIYDGTSPSNAVSATTDDGQGWSSTLTLRTAWCNNNVSRPNALAIYPGASATIGSSTEISIRATDASASPGPCMGGWTFSGGLGGFTALSQQNAISFNGPTSSYPTGGSEPWRLVGFQITCPSANGQTGCIHTANMGNTANDNKLFGNYVYNVGNTATQPNTDQQHGIYMGDQSRHWELAWNEIYNVQACRGIQVYSNYKDEFDFSIHDNLVHSTTCDGINVFTYDPSQTGGINLYNNLIHHVGIGPMPSDNGGSFDCIYFSRGTESGTPGSGTANVYNNTCYDFGAITNVSYDSCSNLAGINISNDGDNTAIDVRNNIIYAVNSNSFCPSGQPYYYNGTSSSTALSGSNNLMYGFGCTANPCSDSHITNSVTGNPGFVNAGSANFHLSSSSSPANGAGSTSPPVPTYDHDGLTRPSPPAIGAYEFSSGSEGAPNPPTNLTVVVN